MRKELLFEGTGVPEARTVRNANQNWKDRYRSWVARSTLIAAIVHLVLFVVIPSWTIFAARVPRPMQFVQIDPRMADVGGELNMGDEGLRAAPAITDLELEVREGGQGSDVEGEIQALLLEIFGYPQPSVLNPILPRTVREEIAPPAPPLELTEVFALTPRLATVGPQIQLPVIRNPAVLQRFLRSRYNPMHASVAHNGYVSVALSIDARGGVEWTAITSSSGSELIDQIALAVFTDVAIFTPARSEGRRVPVSVVISVPFTAPW